MVKAKNASGPHSMTSETAIFLKTAKPVLHTVPFLDKAARANPLVGLPEGRSRLVFRVPVRCPRLRVTHHLPLLVSLLVQDPVRNRNLHGIIGRVRIPSRTALFSLFRLYDERWPLSRMTLAQRLGELATANEQGLLECVILFSFSFRGRTLTSNDYSDDEYRLLRANLFERFANVSTVPREAPIVRLSVSAQSSPSFRCSYVSCAITDAIFATGSRIPSPSSYTSRPDSVHSRVSIVSTLSGLLRRTTSRRFKPSPGSQPPTSSDSMIPTSTTSSPVQNRTLPRHFLRREASDSSLGSELSAHRTSEYPRGGTPTSRKSSRNPPPSSYSIRAFKSVPSTPTRDHKHHSSDVFDLNGEHTQSVKELRAEIESVEAEGRRLLDAFNGLELSTLTRRQRRPITLQMATETDTISTHSGRSASIRGPRQTSTNSNPQPLVSQPITLSRKNSLSSMSSRGRSVSGSNHALPSTSLNSLGKFGTSTGSTSSVNNAGFTTLETVEEGSDPALATLEGEMADIRRRRTEVVARYEAKLELLRAKLKGAEMHEKLLKR